MSKRGAVKLKMRTMCGEKEEEKEQSGETEEEEQREEVCVSG